MGWKIFLIILIWVRLVIYFSLFPISRKAFLLRLEHLNVFHWKMLWSDYSKNLYYLISLSLCSSSYFHDSKRAKQVLADKNFFSLYHSAVYLSLCVFVWTCFLWLTSFFVFGMSLHLRSVWLYVTMPYLLR